MDEHGAARTKTSPKADDRLPAGAEFDEKLRAALPAANLPTLLLVLRQLTGDPAWLDPPYRPTHPRGLGDHDDAGLGPGAQAEVRRAAYKAIRSWRAGTLPPVAPPTADTLTEVLGLSLAEPVPSEYGGLLAEELGVVSRRVESDGSALSNFDVVIVGAGMAGINLGIMLKAAGVPFVIIEKSTGVGGTWLENRYPGCGVDTPSHLYSFSFARNSQWSGYFAKRDEVKAYFEDLAEKNGLYDHIELGTEVLRAEWSESDAEWALTVRRANGREDPLRANVLVSAVGHFNRPSIPELPGLGTFPGPVVHTAQWDPALDLSGKRVAVVGSGASAMQIVPTLAGSAAELLVYQRSRQWAVPHPNCGRPVSPEVQWLLEYVPWYAGFYRLRQFWRFGDRLHPALQLDESYPDPGFAVNETNASHRRFLSKYIASELEGRPDLIAASTPDYPVYGKRPLIDHGWYRTLRRNDVELIDGGLSRVRGKTLVAADGRERVADAIVLATGFQTLKMLGPMDIVGRSGELLREVWGKDDARAYLGITVPSFPNFFMLFGPNTNTGHGGSAFLTTEMQVRYVMQLLKAMIEQRLRVVDCRPEVYRAYNDEVDEALCRTVWTHPKVTNYYRNSSDRIVGTNPWAYVEYWRRTRQADLGDYRTELAPVNDPPVASATPQP